MGHSWRDAAPVRPGFLVTQQPLEGSNAIFNLAPLVRRLGYLGFRDLPLPAGMVVFLLMHLSLHFLSETWMEGNGFSHSALSLTLVVTKPKTHFWSKLLSISL